jgi:hypothetical protein
MPMLMKQVIATVWPEVELSVSDSRSEWARKSAIAFVPNSGRAGVGGAHVKSHASGRTHSTFGM